jgi:hypothetical protein
LEIEKRMLRKEGGQPPPVEEDRKDTLKQKMADRVDQFEQDNALITKPIVVYRV